VIDADSLLADARKTVTALIDDLRTVATTDPDAIAHVSAEHQRATTAGRTAFGQAEWAEGLYAQVAVAWTLGCVFVRFCEDNDLVAEPLLGGPGLRQQLALDQRAAHLHAHPADDDRHWLREIFTRLRSLPATGEVFGTHNPIWVEGLLPSADGARRLREDLTRIDPDTGQIRHDFTDSTWDTRFLGDLYQDLSEHAKKTYALLQTPIFVEEFILDRTLDPAIATFGLADTTVIDPTCGSGHFLLGAFDRLFHRWLDNEPGANSRVLAQRALDNIGGIDLNPFAVSIARFRLLLAALRAGGDSRLSDAPAYDLNIAVGDSLLQGDAPGELAFRATDEETLLADHGYAIEDRDAARDLLNRRWSAVVGNPPYIVVKDAALNAAYRRRFKTCHRQYSLGVPFTERFWQLAHRDEDPARAGYIGLITANSFMKREFGKKLIEEWVPTHELSLLVDTSGAFIPGHGTPTVILLGRQRRPTESFVRAILGIRGEPSRPLFPERGLVWSSILELSDQGQGKSEFVSVSEIPRTRLCSHPWSIGGGGASELRERLEGAAVAVLESRVRGIGRSTVVGADDAWLMPDRMTARRFGVEGEARPFVLGESVRDWRILPPPLVPYPYDRLGGTVLLELRSSLLRRLWPVRVVLAGRTIFGKSLEDRGDPWWVHLEHYPDKLSSDASITFGNVATHNHFALEESPAVLFNSHAPVIKFRPSDSDSAKDVVALLNSSVACFWMKQVSHGKGNGGVNEGYRGEAWEEFWEFDGTKLKQFPLPRTYPSDTAATLAQLALDLKASNAEAIVANSTPSTERLVATAAEHGRIRAQMIASQERLDWECYRLYDLVEGDELAPAGMDEPPLTLGERAFEIVLARRMVARDEVSTWFARHRSNPITELPSHWSVEYRGVVERRIAAIESDPNIGLIEKPEHKRRWAAKPWNEQVKAALRGWLLDRMEDGRYWPAPAAITTVARMAAEARGDGEFMQVARLYAGRDDVDLAALIGELVKGESVAYFAALRYTDTGLRKHAEWRQTWELQRCEDDGEDVGPIPAPPRYGKSDFTGAGWDHRGKLDMPKERFIAYPGAERETDASAVVGWAGWDHLSRARALAAWYLQAKREGRDAAHLTPLLAGLAELVPWLKQWYDEPNADPSLDRPGSQVAALVEAEQRSLGLTADDLTAWRPHAAAKRGRPRKATT
jgi:hypothetical protein